MPDTLQSAATVADEHDALPPGTRFGELEVLRVLGAGGFGIVYLARDHALERDVALKEYMPAALAARGQGAQVTMRSRADAETYAIGLRSFVNEARLLARFDHPSLVRVYRFWEAHGTAYMVMPYLRGRTLREARRAMVRPPDETWIRSVLEPVMGALEQLHQTGVYHRDVAPDNILLTDEGVPVLLDFGAARQVIGDRTQTLTAILKPRYAPIEQYAGIGGLRQGPWTDVYALGAVVHFLVRGTAPAPATSRVLDDPVPALACSGQAGVSPGFLAAVDWALAVRPQDRPGSMALWRAALDGQVVPPTRPAAGASRRPGEPVAPGFERTLRVEGDYGPKTLYARPAETDPEATVIQPAPVVRPAPRPAPSKAPEASAAPARGQRLAVALLGVAALLAAAALVAWLPGTGPQGVAPSEQAARAPAAVELR